MSIKISPIDSEMAAIHKMGNQLVKLSNEERAIAIKKGFIYLKLRQKFNRLTAKAKAHGITLPEQMKSLETYITSLGFAVDSEATRNTLEWISWHFIYRLRMGRVRKGELVEIHSSLLNMAAYRLQLIANYLKNKQDAIEVLAQAGRDVLPTMSAFYAWFAEWSGTARKKIIPMHGGGRPRAFAEEKHTIVEGHELDTVDIRQMVKEMQLPPATPGTFYKISVTVTEVTPPAQEKTS